MNRNDRALYNLLVCQRNLRWLCDQVGSDLEGKSLLEIGTSRIPGLALLLLASGCREYFASNVFAVDPCIRESYVRVLQLVLCGCAPIEPEEIEALIEWRESAESGGEALAVLRTDRFKNLSPRSAEDLELPEGSVDLAFSFSVLEHVSRPREVLANVHRMLRPGGLLISVIDFRDHRDFSQPLAFLRLSDEAYRRACPDGENRLRASAFQRLFREVGLHEEWLGLQDTPPPLAPGGTTDQAQTFTRSLAALLPRRDLGEVRAWVDEVERSTFHPDFQKSSLEELSVVVMGAVHRKRA